MPPDTKSLHAVNVFHWTNKTTNCFLMQKLDFTKSHQYKTTEILKLLPVTGTSQHIKDCAYCTAFPSRITIVLEYTHSPYIVLMNITWWQYKQHISVQYFFINTVSHLNKKACIKILRRTISRYFIAPYLCHKLDGISGRCSRWSCMTCWIMCNIL